MIESSTGVSKREILTPFLTVVLLITLSVCRPPPMEHPNTHFRYALLFDQAGDLRHANEALVLAGQDPHAKPEVDAYLAGIERRKEKAASVLPELQAKLIRTKRERTKSQLFFKLGVCHELLDMREQALRAYDRSIEIHPQQAVYVRRGLLLEAVARYEDSELDLRRAIGFENDSAVARLHLALFLSRAGRAADARVFLPFLREHEPAFAELLDSRLNANLGAPPATGELENLP